MSKKPNVDAAVDDLIGGSAPAPKAAKPTSPAVNKAKAATGKAPTSNKAATPSSNKAAAKPAAKAPAKPAAKVKAKASDDDLVGSKPAPKAKGKAPAKPAAKAKANGTHAARGQGKWYFDPADRDKLAKELKQKVRKPVTTAEYATTHGHETWKVRLAAAQLAKDGVFKIAKSGAVLLMQPK